MPASGPELGPEDFSSTAFSGGAGVEILGTSSRLLMTDSKDRQELVVKSRSISSRPSSSAH
jgi:hypothetical protein